mgnify:CR=1 FL=1
MENGYGFPALNDVEFTIASAVTTNLGSTNSENVFVTGTVTITGLGTVAAGVTKWCRFSGALVLTHNATSLILPNSANYTTAANDCFKFLSLGSGNWICTGYKLQSGASLLMINSGTVIATSSGTSHTFSGLPAGVKEIILLFNGVGTNGINNLCIQIGDSGGIETTGYAAQSGATTSTTQFPINSATVAAETYTGMATLALIDPANNTWVLTGHLASSNATPVAHFSTGAKNLSAPLDRVHLLSAGGTDTFDGGQFNILYQ